MLAIKKISLNRKTLGIATVKPKAAISAPLAMSKKNPERDFAWVEFKENFINPMVSLRFKYCQLPGIPSYTWQELAP